MREVLPRMLEKVSRSLKYDSFFFVHKHNKHISLTSARLFKEKSLVTLAVFPCAGVGMLTPRSDWSSHMIARLITYLR